MSEPTPIGPTSLGAVLVAGMGLQRQVSEAFGLPMPDLKNGKKLFGFHRHKDRKAGHWGFDVWLWIDQAGMNLTAQRVSPFHSKLDDARGWAIDFAKAHGFEARQRAPYKKIKKRPMLTAIDGGKL